MCVAGVGDAGGFSRSGHSLFGRRPHRALFQAATQALAAHTVMGAHDHQRQITDLFAPQLAQRLATDDALAFHAGLFDEMGIDQQMATVQPVDDVVELWLDFHQHQRVELRQQPVEHRHTIGSGHHGNGVILFTQRGTGHRRRAGIGIDTGDDRRFDAFIHAAHGACQVAEGGIGTGIAFHQKQHILTRQQPGQDGIGCLEPGTPQFFGVVGHRKHDGLDMGDGFDAGPLHDAMGVAIALAAAHRIDPAGIATLQLCPGRTGDQVRIAGAEGNANEFAGGGLHGGSVGRKR